jgi:hypothetical protein
MTSNNNQQSTPFGFGQKRVPSGFILGVPSGTGQKGIPSGSVQFGSVQFGSVQGVPSGFGQGVPSGSGFKLGVPSGSVQNVSQGAPSGATTNTALFDMNEQFMKAKQNASQQLGQGVPSGFGMNSNFSFTTSKPATGASFCEKLESATPEFREQFAKELGYSKQPSLKELQNAISSYSLEYVAKQFDITSQRMMNKDSQEVKQDNPKMIPKKSKRVNSKHQITLTDCAIKMKNYSGKNIQIKVKIGDDEERVYQM